MTAANHFDPNLRNEPKLRQYIADVAAGASVVIDAEQLLPVLARWVGWYRLESMPPYNATPREQHEEADALIATIAKLQEQFSGMSPDLLAHVKDKMRHLRIAAPELTRIQACVMAARDELKAPRKGQQRHTSQRDNAIRHVAETIAEISPKLKAGTRNSLAAELVGIELSVKVPSDPKELRKIARG